MNINTVIMRLQKQGFRITNSRKDILTLFKGDHISLSAGEIIKKLQNKTDRATVYRNLNFLISNNILEPIYLKGEVPQYELNKRDHHHHLICIKCKVVSSVSSNSLENAVSEMEDFAKRSNNFTIQDHIAEFYGLCKNCS